MKSVLVGLVLVGATVVTPGTWRVEQGAVRVICPMTIGGSFEAKTMALSGSVTAGAGDSQAFDGSLAVDLRTLDTGIGLRNEHLRENYLEVDKGPGFDRDAVGNRSEWVQSGRAGGQGILHRIADLARREKNGDRDGRHSPGGRRSSREGSLPR